MAMNTVIAYHGTSRGSAKEILSSGFRPSRNDHDWSGSGAYQFEGSYWRALVWAQESHGEEDAAVLRSVVDLSGCLDLTDEPGRALLRPHYDLFVGTRGIDAAAALRQTSGAPRLDCAVINFACARLKRYGLNVRSVRCSFDEGAPLWVDQNEVVASSRYRDKTHIQICVRDPSAILETELVDGAAGTGLTAPGLLP
jgi:hypothetical protein